MNKLASLLNSFNPNTQLLIAAGSQICYSNLVKLHCTPSNFKDLPLLGPLTALQERDIAECFKLLDEDGSGALDISELVKAFKMLGFKVSKDNFSDEIGTSSIHDC